MSASKHGFQKQVCFSAGLLNQVEAQNQPHTPQQAESVDRMSQQAEYAEVIQDYRDDKLADDGCHQGVGDADAGCQHQDGGDENDAVDAAGVIKRRGGFDLRDRWHWRVKRHKQEKKKDDGPEKRDEGGLKRVVEAFAQVGIYRTLNRQQAAHTQGQCQKHDVFHFFPFGATIEDAMMKFISGGLQATSSSRWTVSGVKAGRQTAMYSAPSGSGVL